MSSEHQMTDYQIQQVSKFTRDTTGDGWQQACRAYGVDPAKESFGVAYVKDGEGKRWSFITYDIDLTDPENLTYDHSKPGWFTDSPTW